MATLDQLAYNIRNIARNGQGDHDDVQTRLSIKQIKFWIQQYRAFAIMEGTDYGKEIDQDYIQDLGMVPLTEVDMADPQCPCEPKWGCVIKKLVIELPDLVDFPDNRSLVFVGKIDRITPIVIDTSDTTVYERETRYGKLFNRAYRINNNLYFYLREKDADMKYVNIRAVFEDPTKVSRYTHPNCEPTCYDDAKDAYPMPIHLNDYITTNILQKELNVTLNTINDQMNNAKDEVKG